MKDPENGFLDLFSAIRLDIWQRFKEENISFPYPQREVRILNDLPHTAGGQADAQTKQQENDHAV